MCTMSGDKYILKSVSELSTLQIERLLYLSLPHVIIAYDTQNNENGGVDYFCVCELRQECMCVKNNEPCNRVIPKSLVDEFYKKVQM